MNQLVNGVTIILTAIYFQNVVKDIGYIQYINLVICIVLTSFTIICLPESPRYLYSYNRFEETRESLAMVAKLNGVKEFKPDQIVFETEKIQQDKLQNSNYQSEGSQE